MLQLAFFKALLHRDQYDPVILPVARFRILARLLHADSQLVCDVAAGSARRIGLIAVGCQGAKNGRLEWHKQNSSHRRVWGERLKRRRSDTRMTSLRLAAVDVPVVVLALLVLLVWAEQEEESCAADQNCPMGEEEKEVHNERKSQDLDIHEVYERLRQKMKRVKAACGSLCRTWSSEATSEGVTAEDLDTDYSRVTPLKKEVNCNALFLSPDMDAEAETLRPLMKVRRAQRIGIKH